MAKKRKVEVELVFDADGAVTRIRDVDGKFLKLGRTVKKTEKGVVGGFGRIGSSAKRFLGPLGAAGLASGAAFAFGTMTRSVVETGMKFQQSMARVGALSQATGTELSKLTGVARELGATTVFSATEAAEGMQFLAMAGFNTNQIIQAMPGLLDQAAAGQIDLGRAADITSNVLSGFGLAAAESSRVADVLTKASISSNTTIEGLGQSMAFVAPVAESLGLSFEELTAAIGIMGDAGIQSTRAGTALRGSLLQLAAPSRKQREIMDELGFSFTKADGSTKSLAQIVGELESKTKAMTKAQRTATLAILVGQEAASGFATLIGRGADNLERFTGELMDSGGTAKEVADKQINTLAGSVQLLNSALADLSLTIFNSFSNELQNTVDGTTKSVGKLEKFLSFDMPAALNIFRFKVGRANADILKLFGASEESIQRWESLAMAGSAALEGLFDPAPFDNIPIGPPLPDDLPKPPGDDTTPTGTPDSGKQPKDPLARLQKEREELIQKGLLTERLIILTTKIADIENQRTLLREGSKTSALEAAQIELVTNEQLIASGMKRTEAVLDNAQREIDADRAKIEMKKALLAADAEMIRQNIATSDSSIQTAGDAASAIAASVRQVIQAKIAETIAKSIATIPFPANLVLGGVAAAGINLLFSNLIPQFATGVTGFSGGVAMVGERGPELVNLPQGSNVITNENTEKLIQSISGAGSPQNDFSQITRELREVRASNESLMNTLANRPVVAHMDTRQANTALKRFEKQQEGIGSTL